MSMGRRLLLGAIVVAATLLTYWPQRDALLDIRQDDHRILFSGSDNPLHQQVLGVRGPSGLEITPTLEWGLVSDATEGGRFRPVTQALEIYLPRLLGTEASHWHAALLLLTGLACAALYLAGQGVFASAPLAGLFALMVMLAPDPGPARTWYMMSTKAEAVGTLLVACAIFAASRAALGRRARSWDSAAILCALLAGLTKEPFVLVLPALAALRIWLEAREARISEWQGARRLLRLMALYAGVFVALMVAIALTVSASSVASYGGATLRSSSVFLAGLSSILLHLPQQSIWFIPAILCAYALWRAGGFAGAMRTAAPALAIGALWIVPQVLLYAGRGGMWDHYWLPCTIGIAGLNTAALAYLSGTSNAWLFRAALIAVLLWTANGIRVNVQTVANFAARTHAQQDALQEIVRRTPAEGKVLVVADGDTLSEYSLSWLFFLAHQGRPDTRVYFYDTHAGRGGRFSGATFFPHQASLAEIPACEFSAIIFLSQPQRDDLNWTPWYAKGCHEVRSFSRPQHYLSLRQLGWTAGEFNVTVAIAAQKKGD